MWLCEAPSLVSFKWELLSLSIYKAVWPGHASTLLRYPQAMLSLSGTSCVLVPSEKSVWLRIKEWKMHWPQQLFFMPPKELWEAYSNRTVRPSVRPSRFRVRSISLIFFEVGIPNLVCGYILGWRSVAYHFRITVTLTSDLVFIIIMSGAYLLYYLR